LDPEKKRRLRELVATYLNAPEGRKQEALAAALRLRDKQRREDQDPHRIAEFEIPADRKIM
jgi:hypothetical protein